MDSTQRYNGLANKNRYVSLMVFILVGFDLLSKWAMTALLANPPTRISLLPFFDLVLVFNRGISFGALSDIGPTGPSLILIVTVFITALLILWLKRSKNWLEIYGLTLLVGGSIGNIIDRLVDQAVTDFLKLYAGQFHWPIFNFADVFISIGAICLIASSQKQNSNSL